MSTPTRTIQPGLEPLHRAVGHLFGPIDPFLIATFQETKADIEQMLDWKRPGSVADRAVVAAINVVLTDYQKQLPENNQPTK